MAAVLPRWDSQPLAAWTADHAAGTLLSLDGMQTHYVAKGTGKPVILLHGFFFDSTLWCRNLEYLARTHRVYALDLWGFGYSARTTQPSYALYSGQLAAFMQALDIEQATLVGQSLGGGVAIQFSVEHPGKVDKLVLVDSAGLANPDPVAAQLFRVPGIGEALLNFPGNALRRKMLKDFFLYRPDTVSPELFRHLTWSQKIAGTTASALALMRRGFADKLEGVLPRLAALDLPTLIVWGAQDRATRPALGQRLHQALPGSILSVIQNAGHVPNLEQAEPFNARVDAFLRGTAPFRQPVAPLSRIAP
jgi:pimeloyl-ACP methyl ester carboxylesterase